MDIDNLRVGQRFDIELAKALENTQVFLCVIGQHIGMSARGRVSRVKAGPHGFTQLYQR